MPPAFAGRRLTASLILSKSCWRVKVLLDSINATGYYQFMRTKIKERETTSPGFGSRLRTAREKIGISVSELARRVGVKQPTIWLLENDRRGPSFTLACRLAKVLGVAVSELDPE